jgi:hypothetical protein
MFQSCSHSTVADNLNTRREVILIRVALATPVLCPDGNKFTIEKNPGSVRGAHDKVLLSPERISASNMK